jgi:hypothetical protein
MTAVARCFSLTLLGVLACSDHVCAQDFYAGKRLTIVINYAAGGPADIEGRLVAKHIGKHIPGRPTIIVQNMDGAGGLIGVNYIGEIAPRDGTVLGLVTGAAWPYASKPMGRKVDFRDYEFVAYQPGTTVYFARRDIKPGLNKPEDLGKAEGMISGGLGADSGKDILLRLALDMLGKKYKYVTGYRGSSAARLALQQGEINYYSESPPSYRSVVEKSLVAKGIAIGLFHDTGWDGERYFKPRQVEGLPLLPYHELYKKITGKMPEGKYWDAYRAVIALNHAFQRMAIFPPGTSKAAIEAIRVGFAGLDKDEAYAAEGRKAFGFAPDFVSESDTNARVRKALVVSPEMRAFIAKYVEDGTKLK